MTTGASMDFLAHLVRREWVSEEKADEALDRQRKSRATIGQIALRLKLLTVKQLFEVMRVQLESRQQFGAIAVSLGYMSNDDVNDVLSTQQAETTSIGTILVQMGALTVEQLDLARHDFESEPERARPASAPNPRSDRLASCNDARPPAQSCKVA
jgi:hypothetical protein